MKKLESFEKIYFDINDFGASPDSLKLASVINLELRSIEEMTCEKGGGKSENGSEKLCLTSCPGINTVIVSRCHASDRVKRRCPESRSTCSILRGRERERERERERGGVARVVLTVPRLLNFPKN